MDVHLYYRWAENTASKLCDKSKSAAIAFFVMTMICRMFWRVCTGMPRSQCHCVESRDQPKAVHPTWQHRSKRGDLLMENQVPAVCTSTVLR